jgi:hypothetical protein
MLAQGDGRWRANLTPEEGTMRRHRRRDSPDTIELLLKLALGEIRLD